MVRFRQTHKTALKDRQKSLNLIRAQTDAVDTETKWAALELMLGTSYSIGALAKKMATLNTKNITRTISIPKTKIIKQPVPQPGKPTTNDTVRTAIKPVSPQKPLPNKRAS